MKYIISLILFLSFSTASYACDINFIKFGSNPLNFPLNTQTKIKKHTNDLVTITAPINLFCNKVELNGTNVDFLFIKNQLVRIKISRENFQIERSLNSKCRNKSVKDTWSIHKIQLRVIQKCSL